ncbi:hypothetical protein [uncultured Desulfobacter sp.]|uniref:hypothetical protein n=1 Tax=uncultured Desulfobacter sp. TaxID=240139 RepID=UPI0029F48B15|nr:hypothetical protein [uncultured Desulfobacter sp.]
MKPPVYWWYSFVVQLNGLLQISGDGQKTPVNKWIKIGKYELQQNLINSKVFPKLCGAFPLNV